MRGRATQQSAEVIVAKRAGESRKERRTEEPREEPTNRTLAKQSEKSSETDWERQLSVTTRTGLEGKESGTLKEPKDGRQARGQANGKARRDSL